MSKGTKALKKLTEYLTGDYNDNVYEWLSEIEEELKEKERLKTSYLENLLNEESKEYIYKKLTALEIIVKKANIRLFILKGKSDKDTRYYFMTTSNLYEISKDKYDLLKEVLE